MSEQQVAEEIRASPQDAGASQDPPAIELHGVVKEFRSHGEVVTAVRDLHVAIAEGEFFSLLGPSGCGKTTTMRMVAGFEEPTAGTVYLHGTDVTNVPPHKRDVNMVFQSYALFPHMTVFDNVAFGLRRKNTPKKEVTDRVTDILGVVGLDGYAKRRPRQLSGGQQQRVALARALVNRPRALLLDEPLGALDLKLRQAMQIELKRIQREVGITFVYVTHDQGEALTMLRVPLGLPTIIVAHIMFCLSFVAVTVRARVLTLDRSLEEAARDLGAGPWATFRLVTLPLIFPGVLAGALLAFAISIDDFVVTSFVSGSTQTFPLWIWSATRNGLPPQVDVLGTLIFVAGLVIAATSALLGRRGTR